MLEQYITIVLNVETQKGDNHKFIKYKMRFCTAKDFENGRIEDFENRLCPDISKDDEIYGVYGYHSNKNDRGQFALQIRECDRWYNSKCKSK